MITLRSLFAEDGGVFAADHMASVGSLMRLILGSLRVSMSLLGIHVAIAVVCNATGNGSVLVLTIAITFVLLMLMLKI